MAWKVERQIGRHPLTIETGSLAKQAQGAVTVRYGDTVVLVTAVSGPKPDYLDFFPLTVDYREKTSAAGKFPGGFIKREGRPTTKETCTMRLIDRPIRPLFPDDYEADLQVMASVLSADPENDPDVLSLIGAGAALQVSDIPWNGPIGAVRVGRVGGEFVVMPTYEELKTSEIDLIVAGTRDAVLMVEAGATEVVEAVMIEALAFGHGFIREIVDMVTELQKQCGKPKEAMPAPKDGSELATRVEAECGAKLKEVNFVKGKLNRGKALNALVNEVVARLATPAEGAEAARYTTAEVKDAFFALEKKIVRAFILEGRRPDGRSFEDIRPISIEVGVLPRTHGSAVFTRGETQALCMATLGTVSDGQRVEGLLDEYKKRFMLDYNFPPFSVGEVKPVRGPSRRDIGHGALAERALSAVMPGDDKFPYTIRVISDILESNGSSSMATVCGATLCLMDAGVPVSHPVAGIAMGLITDGDRKAILTDIQGAEDHYGDMDFKVAGTQAGITALQMDIKTGGISEDLMAQALEQARKARIEILRKMLAVIERPRDEISVFAPRLERLVIPQDKIGTVIGPGGKVIRAIQEETGCQIDIEDDGTIVIAGPSTDAVLAARATIEGLTASPEVGRTYEGKVVSIKDFGAFVEILPGQDGLLHVSELSDTFVKDVGSVVKMGDKVRVKIIAVDDQGRIKLSRKAVLLDEKKAAAKKSAD
ncbi:MAG TPA: polyribonucleotide nucleotidyltransferase [Planctomycetota bacterium]|nr:polyribonucleotide nucleotidyltransferase [Planctomycetota bacterium]